MVKLPIVNDMTQQKKIDDAVRESEIKFRIMADTAPVMIWMSGVDKLCTYFNKPWLEFTGRTMEQESGNGWVNGVHPQDVEKCLRTYVTAFDAREKFKMEYRLRQADGQYRWILDQGVPYFSLDNKFAGYIGSAVDITEEILIQKNLRGLKDNLELEKDKLIQVLSIEEGLNTILNIDKLIDFVVHKTSTVLDAERCSLMLLDEKTQELCIKGYHGAENQFIQRSRIKIGEPVSGIVAQQDKPVLVTDIETDRRFFKTNRSTYKIRSFISAPIRLNERLMGVINVADKVSNTGEAFSSLDVKVLTMIIRQVAVAIETAKLYRELNYLTITDPLTNIYNYRHFAQSLDREINRAKRYRIPLCLLMLDVDDFKVYNDAYGHLEGDRLLKEIGKTLKGNLRDVDIVCRYAGDEFAVILPQIDEPEAVKVAKKIQLLIAEIDLKQKITATCEIAIHKFPMDRYDLILKADTALYNAKKDGKRKLMV